MSDNSMQNSLPSPRHKYAVDQSTLPARTVFDHVQAAIHAQGSFMNTPAPLSSAEPMWQPGVAEWQASPGSSDFQAVPPQSNLQLTQNLDVPLRSLISLSEQDSSSLASLTSARDHDSGGRGVLLQNRRTIGERGAATKASTYLDLTEEDDNIGGDQQLSTEFDHNERISLADRTTIPGLVARASAAATEDTFPDIIDLTKEKKEVDVDQQGPAQPSHREHWGSSQQAAISGLVAQAVAAATSNTPPLSGHGTTPAAGNSSQAEPAKWTLSDLKLLHKTHKNGKTANDLAALLPKLTQQQVQHMWYEKITSE